MDNTLSYVFKSTLRVEQDGRLKGRSFQYLVTNKSANAELFSIGYIGGEDAPFNATIFVLKWGDKIIPFLAEEEILINYISVRSLSEFNLKHKKDGVLRRTILPIILIGNDLKSLRVGPRASVSYTNVFGDHEKHEYIFKSKAEYESTLLLIDSAIRTYKFDDNKLPYGQKSNSSFCKTVTYEKTDYKDRAIKLEKAISFFSSHPIDEYLFSPTECPHTLQLFNDPNPTLQDITEKLFEMEKNILSYDYEKFNFGRILSKEFREILKQCFDNYLSQVWTEGWEEFLIRLLVLLHDRQNTLKILVNHKIV